MSQNDFLITLVTLVFRKILSFNKKLQFLQKKITKNLGEDLPGMDSER